MSNLIRPPVALAVLAASALGGGLAASLAPASAATRASAARPTPRYTAHRLKPRSGAVAPATTISSSSLFTTRVFANGSVGFALANDGQAQYPALSTDGGKTWKIDGPQVHVDAADAPAAVGSVGVVGTRTYFAYGSSAIDVTTDGGHTWWQTFVGELVVAVVPGPHHELIAYVQQSLSTRNLNPVVTWQYVSRDGGRHWRYSTSLGGF
jgi:photosystem II stability/assembly factor-like uncharacterized protein